MGWSQVVTWVSDTKDYVSEKFGLKPNNVHGTCFANGTRWLKVFVLCHGLYIAPLSMIFCIAQSYNRMSMYIKFHSIWVNIFSTSFVKHQMGQSGVGEASIP